MLIANELVEDYRVNRKRGAVFKIDFEKTYDNVEWHSWILSWKRKHLGINGDLGFMAAFP